MVTVASKIDTFAAFNRFVTFFSELFAQPGLLADAACRQSYKEYVPDYYRDVFGPQSAADSQRHLKWYRRLSALFALPPGSSILDYGGGYGMDSIFLASLGYQLVFYEISPHHIAIARWFAERFGAKYGSLPIHFVLAGKDTAPAVDAILANEVTHHIEPAEQVFDDAARLLRPGGSLYLLEPNFMSPMTQAFFLKVRGLRTTEWKTDEVTGKRYLWGNEHIRPVSSWNGMARKSGFALKNARYVAPWYRGSKTESALMSRSSIEKWPVTRDLLTSHVTLHYLKE